jgi:hypothetical protein
MPRVNRLERIRNERWELLKSALGWSFIAYSGSYGGWMRSCQHNVSLDIERYYRLLHRSRVARMRLR